MFCHKCGAPLVDDANFCSQCGERRTVPATEDSAAKENPPEQNQASTVAGMSAVADVAAPDDVQAADLTEASTETSAETPAESPTVEKAPSVTTTLHTEPAKRVIYPPIPGKGFAIASFILGVFSLTCFGLVPAILALVFAGSANKRGYVGTLARAGRLCGTVGLTLAVLSILLYMLSFVTILRQYVL